MHVFEDPISLQRLKVSMAVSLLVYTSIYDEYETQQCPESITCHQPNISNVLRSGVYKEFFKSAGFLVIDRD